MCSSQILIHQIINHSPWPVYAASSSLALVVGLVGAIHSYVGGNHICINFNVKNLNNNCYTIFSTNFIINPNTPSLTDDFQIWIICYLLTSAVYDYFLTGKKLITSIPYMVVVYVVLTVVVINYVFDEGFYLFNFFLKVSSSLCVYLFFKRIFSTSYPSWFSFVAITIDNKQNMYCCKFFIFCLFVFIVYYFVEKIIDVFFSSRYFTSGVLARFSIRLF